MAKFELKKKKFENLLANAINLLPKQDDLKEESNYAMLEVVKENRVKITHLALHGVATSSMNVTSCSVEGESKIIINLETFKKTISILREGTVSIEIKNNEMVLKTKKDTLVEQGCNGINSVKLDQRIKKYDQSEKCEMLFSLATMPHYFTRSISVLEQCNYNNIDARIKKNSIRKDPESSRLSCVLEFYDSNPARTVKGSIMCMLSGNSTIKKDLYMKLQKDILKFIDSHIVSKMPKGEPVLVGMNLYVDKTMSVSIVSESYQCNVKYTITELINSEEDMKNIDGKILIPKIQKIQTTPYDFYMKSSDFSSLLDLMFYESEKGLENKVFVEIMIDRIKQKMIGEVKEVTDEKGGTKIKKSTSDDIVFLTENCKCEEVLTVKFNKSIIEQVKKIAPSDVLFRCKVDKEGENRKMMILISENKEEYRKNNDIKDKDGNLEYDYYTGELVIITLVNIA